MFNNPDIFEFFGLQKYESLFNKKNYKQKSNICRIISSLPTKTGSTPIFTASRGLPVLFLVRNQIISS